MDQNSTNDTDKRNWRERLGIGGKEMPRISGEFTKTPETIARGSSARAPGPGRGKTGPHGATPAHEGRAAPPPPGPSSRSCRRVVRRRLLMPWPRNFAPSAPPPRDWPNSG